MATYKVTSHWMPREDLAELAGVGPINSCFVPRLRVMRYECNGKYAELEPLPNESFETFLDREVECCRVAFGKREG